MHGDGQLYLVSDINVSPSLFPTNWGLGFGVWVWGLNPKP